MNETKFDINTFLKDIPPVNLEIVLGDITEQDCDAIVNAANKNLQRGGGVCGAIFEKANSLELQEECNKLAPIKTGEAIITSGYNLKAKYIIHAVGPQYRDSSSEPLLRNAYLNSLELAEKYHFEKLAFPSISTGIYGYPIKDAARIAIGAIKTFKNRCLKSIKIVCYNKETFDEYIKALEEHERCKKEVVAFLKEAFQNTSIYLKIRVGDKDRLAPSVKFVYETGDVIFVSNHRHLYFVNKQIPNYDKKTTFDYLEELHNEGAIILCEADKKNNYYHYTITLKNEALMEA